MTNNNINTSSINPVTGVIPQPVIPNTFGADTIIPPLDPGITTTDAYSLGQINGNLTIQQAVGGSDSGDAYSFSITDAGEYSFSLDGLTADASLEIFDAQGNLLDFSDANGNVSESLEMDFDPGNYFASVNSYSGAQTNYSLNISGGNSTVNTLEPSLDPGNTFDTALDFGTFTNDGNNVFAFSDAVGGEDAVDLFQFTVTESQQFSAAIDNLTADADLALFDSNNQIIAYSLTDGIVESESFSTTISPGTYILGVESYDGIETNYNLNITSDVGGSIGGEFPPIIPPGGVGGNITNIPEFIENNIYGDPSGSQSFIEDIIHA